MGRRQRVHTTLLRLRGPERQTAARQLDLPVPARRQRRAAGRWTPGRASYGGGPAGHPRLHGYAATRSRQHVRYRLLLHSVRSAAHRAALRALRQGDVLAGRRHHLRPPPAGRVSADGRLRLFSRGSDRHCLLYPHPGQVVRALDPADGFSEDARRIAPLRTAPSPGRARAPRNRVERSVHPELVHDGERRRHLFDRNDAGPRGEVLPACFSDRLVAVSVRDDGQERCARHVSHG